MMYIYSIYNGADELHTISSFNNAVCISDLTNDELIEAIRIIEKIYEYNNPDVSCSEYLPDYNTWLDAASERGIIKIYSKEYINSIEDNRHGRFRVELPDEQQLEDEQRVEEYNFFDEDLDRNSRIRRPLAEIEHLSAEQEIPIRSSRPLEAYLRRTLQND